MDVLCSIIFLERSSRQRSQLQRRGHHRHLLVGPLRGGSTSEATEDAAVGDQVRSLPGLAVGPSNTSSPEVPRHPLDTTLILD